MKCPICEKEYKHLLAHLKNKHRWSDEQIAQFKIPTTNDMLGELPNWQDEVRATVHWKTIHIFCKLNANLSMAFHHLEKELFELFQPINLKDEKTLLSIKSSLEPCHERMLEQHLGEMVHLIKKLKEPFY